MDEPFQINSIFGIKKNKQIPITQQYHLDVSHQTLYEIQTLHNKRPSLLWCCTMLIHNYNVNTWDGI